MASSVPGRPLTRVPAVAVPERRRRPRSDHGRPRVRPGAGRALYVVATPHLPRRVIPDAESWTRLQPTTRLHLNCPP